MAKTRIYHFPSGRLGWAGETNVRFVPGDIGLTLILDGAEHIVTVELDPQDLRSLLLDVAAAIAKHGETLDNIRQAPPRDDRG